MTQNYILEDGVNFWDMLNDNDDNDYNDHNDYNKNHYESDEKLEKATKVDSICLLTKLPLTKNYIQLDCGHTFNYSALLEEVKHQKKRRNYKNPIQFSYYCQFYCPYCRKIMNGLLPYIPTECKEKIKYVNSPTSLSIKHRDCSYIFSSGKNKGNKCCSNSAFDTDIGTYCNRHYTICLNKILKLNNKHKKENKLENKFTNTEKEFIQFYKTHTIPQIKEILRKLNLNTSGNKKTLVERYFMNHISI